MNKLKLTKNMNNKLILTRIKAFTLLDSLLTLAITTFMILSLSVSVSGIFQRVEEKLFFLSFENLYRDTQKLANIKQESMILEISESQISNGLARLDLPDGIKVVNRHSITFNQAGGNSSLTKIVFESGNKRVTYQLYIGSGNYKKIESESLYSP